MMCTKFHGGWSTSNDFKSCELKLLNDGNMAKSEITKNVDFSKSRKKIWGFSKNTPGECSEEDVYKVS